MDVVLQVAHQHQVAGLVPARVQGVVVDVAEDGAGADAVGAILGVDELAEVVHEHGAVLGLALLLVLLRLDHTKQLSKSRRQSRQLTSWWDPLETWMFFFFFFTLDSPWRPRVRR